MQLTNTHSAAIPANRTAGAGKLRENRLKTKISLHGPGNVNKTKDLSPNGNPKTIPKTTQNLLKRHPKTPFNSR
jgi:hypothetical protein